MLVFFLACRGVCALSSAKSRSSSVSDVVQLIPVCLLLIVSFMIQSMQNVKRKEEIPGDRVIQYTCTYCSQEFRYKAKNDIDLHIYTCNCLKNLPTLFL